MSYSESQDRMVVSRIDSRRVQKSNQTLSVLKYSFLYRGKLSAEPFCGCIKGVMLEVLRGGEG